MQWENLTSLDFARAVTTTQGVGIVTIGVVEAHASQLPLGTDMFAVHWAACQAAELETAIVFPAYPFGINHEAAHLPGGLVLKRDLCFALLENICDEMHRNGLSKIILVSGHGGNRYFLPLFVQTLPEKAKPYVVYLAEHTSFLPEGVELFTSDEIGHACEAETSMILHIKPDTVKMDQVPPRPFTNLQRNQPIAAAGGYTQADWYAMYPHMYVGDARAATAEKGAAVMNYQVEQIVALIRAVKADNVTPGLVREFNERQAAPSAPAFWTTGDV